MAIVSTSSAIEASNFEEDLPDFLVAGFFNEVYYQGSTLETTIELYSEDTKYLWEYNEEEGWNGDLDYLDEDNTYYIEEEGRWKINFAIDDEVPIGDDWTLVLDGEEYNIRVVEADTTVSLSGSLQFNFEPYTLNVESTDSITLTNEGNVPMAYKLKKSDENLILEPTKDVLDPGESINLNFVYLYSSNGPEMFSLDLSLTAEHLGYLDFESEGNIGRKSQPGFGINSNVIVGYEDYEQEKIEDYSVQYRKSISVKGDTYNQVTFYVYPNEEIYIDFNNDNIEFDEENITITVRDEGGEELGEIGFDSNEPLSPDYGEVEITVYFKSHHQNDGSSELTVEGDSYITEINVSEAAANPNDTTVSFVEEEAGKITLGIVLIGGILAFGAARVLLSRRKKED